VTQSNSKKVMDCRRGFVIVCCPWENECGSCKGFADHRENESGAKACQRSGEVRDCWCFPCCIRQEHVNAFLDALGIQDVIFIVLWCV